MLHTVPRHKEWIGFGHGQDKSMSETYCPQVATNLLTPQMFLYSSSRCRKKEIPSLSFFFFSSDHLSRRPSTAGIIGSADSLDVDRSPVPQMMTKQHHEEQNERILPKAQHEKNKTGTGIHIKKTVSPAPSRVGSSANQIQWVDLLHVLIC